MEAEGVVYNARRVWRLKGYSLQCKESMEAEGVVYNTRRVWRPEG